MGKHEETKEEILGEPVALQKSSQSLVLGKAGKSTFKALLVSADMSQGDHLRSFLDHKFYVLMTNHFGEWRSKPAMESGLTPKWTNEQVKIDFKETTNILTIQMKDQKNAQAASPAIGKATVESLLKDGLVDVPLKTPKDETVGYIRFQSFHNQVEQEQAGSDEEVDEKYPHVKPKCMVCNSTHKNNVGTPYACHHCVCIRCNGKGVKKDGNTCTGMKTM